LLRGKGDGSMVRFGVSACHGRGPAAESAEVVGCQSATTRFWGSMLLCWTMLSGTGEAKAVTLQITQCGIQLLTHSLLKVQHLQDV
jgi:hypothetical protein